MTIISERQSSQVGFAHALSLNLTITDVVAEAIKICPCFQGGTPWLKLNGPVVWQVRNTHEQWWTLPVYWWVTENHHILSHREERAMTKGKENPWRRLHSVVSVLVVSWETIILPRKKPLGVVWAIALWHLQFLFQAGSKFHALKSSSLFFSQWWQSLL